MIHQLRTYEIFEHNKSAFHERFRDHAARIMRKYGFNTVAMWEAQTEWRFSPLAHGGVVQKLICGHGLRPAVAGTSEYDARASP